MDIIAIRKERAKILKEYRIEIGLTKTELSNLSGLHRTTIDSIESGTIGWNIDSELIYFETLKNHIKV